ncbi:Radical_SAM domain containing protein [uncultured Caudovirales phage]|uniref:Radical_SAM domain containing protein n=1 Tax=uncultured Caudovirales phage TaxID=2100421 RepID=A0A6J7WVB5_9CAUD|nr:Radical_SAM domain containing protein [uncultured Caudovirales phage]
MALDLAQSSYDFSEIPFDRIVKLGQRSLLHRDTFVVSWILGRFCNYNCSYCWPYAHSQKKDHRSTELCLSTIDEIKRQARENGFNSFHFSLSGGEPTFHPGYLDILQHLSDDIENTNYTSIHMTTNLSQNLKWFEKYVAVSSKLHKAMVTASYHREYVNSHEKRVLFADKLEFLQQYDVNVTINMVMVPEWFDQIYEEALYFHSRGINVTLKPQSDPKASYVVEGYTKEMLDKLHNGMPQRAYTDNKSKIVRPPYKASAVNPKLNLEKDDLNVPQQFNVELEDDTGKKWYMDQAERFNAFNFNDFKGWSCNSGYQSIIIREPDGSVKRSYSCSDQPLGNINTGFKLFDKPMPCISKSCVSSADSKIPKVKYAAV